MSKAKELAREILSWHHLSNTDISLSLCNLADAVLSEPEPELKGWIETEAPYNKELRMLINLTTGTKLMETTHSSIGCYLRVLNSDNDTDLKESYDEIKQLIARAS